LFFRGVVFTTLLVVLKKLYPEERATRLAVTFGAVSFGLAHLGNFFTASLALSFVLPQVIFATLLGAGCCYLMARTRSLCPAILLHAVVNFVAILF
jgi:membrane protease YdiL (CAAX protease family)